MNTQKTILAIGCCLLMTVSAEAQRGGGDFGGGRGGGGGDRGGFGGGGRGGPPGGGAPGGDRSSRGGDRGSRGGFDPSSFLTRLDSNGNGVLDPDEQKGPAQFIITRLQQSDPSIKAGQPISIKKVSELFTKMREQRSGGDSTSSRSSRGGSSADDSSLEVELLVPGFGVESEPIPLMGFGPAAEMLSVAVTDADKSEAARAMRFDRNKDGFLSKEEVAQFAGNPMDFDRNKDGKLTVKELSVRYARRREGREEAQAKSKKDGRRTERRRDDDKEIDVYDGRKSYRMTDGKSLPEGIPGFFADKDSNADGQVTMVEFASEWNDDVVSEFFKSDLNRDGTITAAEAIRAVENGVSVSAPAATASSSRMESSGSSKSTASTSSTAASKSPGNAQPDKKLVQYAERIIGRYDKNKDGALVVSEWSSMLLNPAPADANRDGRITIDEYALYLESRSRKK